MADEQLSEKIEETIAGAKDFAVRLCRTVVILAFRPRRLLLAVQDGFKRRRYLYPHAFLLSCAIALGFSGRILAEGIENVGIDILNRVSDLTFSSFLNHSIPVFGIAIAAAIAVEFVLPEQDSDKKRHFKDLNYYVIGFFGIGSLLVLLLLAWLLSATFDNFGPRTQFFVGASYIATIGYVIALYGLLYWLTSNALRGEPGTALSWNLSARTLLLNALVIVLCVLNFISPLYEHVGGAPVLKGRMIDLASQPGGTLRLTYLVENVSNTDVVVSRLDRPTLVAELGDARAEPQGQFGADCPPDGADSGFVLLAPGTSQILVTCTAEEPMRSLLDGAGVGAIERANGEKSFPVSERGFALSIKLRASVGGGRTKWLTIDL